MKICTLKISTKYGTLKRAGLFFNESTIIDINHVWQIYFEKWGAFNPEVRSQVLTPASVAQIITSNQAPIEKLQETLELYKKYTKEGILKTKDGAPLAYDMHDDKSLELACPLDKMNSYRDFYAHEKHVKTGFAKRNEPIPPAWYEIPAYYKGSTLGFIGHKQDIFWPNYTKQLDYELELGMILGRDGRNIKAKNAFDHIFGFTILNDISARDIQRQEMSIRLGPAKGKDFCSVMGPVIVTADEFKNKDPDVLMTATINGEEWSRGRSGDCHYSWGEMIEHASREEWLVATDFFGSGTVGTGCGLELDKWIKPGDTITLEIEKIGKLTNLVGPPTT
ncbi:MAG: fumarylacetoacetate hydrolase family protein [Bacteriovoracaceae bacterium]|nr:fumarylacetoacetate hydrolase family protein [Bacteriovoracaceae bacterium]